MRGVVLALILALAGCAAARTAPAPRRAGSGHRPALVAAGGSGPLGFDALTFPTRTAGWVAASINRYGDPGLGPTQVLGTTDAGATWGAQWRGSLVPVQMASTDPAHAWLLGREASPCARGGCRSVLVGTADGGGRWFVLKRFRLELSGVAFVTDNVGVAAAHDASCHGRDGRLPARCPGQVLLTDDGGYHWHTVLRSARAVLAVATHGRTLWAVEARGQAGGVTKPPPVATVVLRQSRDGGRSWTRRGSLGVGELASVRLQLGLLAGPGAQLWMTAYDPDSCAMHGCGIDGVWHRQGRDRRWRAPDLNDPRDRELGTGCAYSGQVPLALSPGGTAYPAPSLDRQDCSGPASTLFRVTTGTPRVVHRWSTFTPVALAWPANTVGYALGQSSLRRSFDAGRTWIQVLPAPAGHRLSRAAP